MPATVAEWAWWTFYTLGSIGGLLSLAMIIADAWVMWRR